MSVAVLGYQIVIFIIIVAAASSGRKALYIAMFIASIWTATHIFVPWLMILQFCTIGFAFLIGLGMSKAEQVAVDTVQEEKHEPLDSFKTFFRNVFSLIFIGVLIWAATEYFYSAPKREAANAQQQAMIQKVRQEKLERDNCIRLLDNKQIAYWRISSDASQRQQWQQREKCLQKVHNGELNYELKRFAD